MTNSPKAKDVIDVMEKNLVGTKEVITSLQNELEVGASTLVPLLQQYLEQIRSVRMGMSSEVREILRSSRELGDLTKSGEAINQFCDACERLHKTLTPEMMETLGRVFGDKGEKTTI